MVKHDPANLTYLEIQALMGTTKHMGGLDSTKELIDLCRVEEATHILDIGCGVGATASHLAKHYASLIVGMDKSKRMIDHAVERLRQENVREQVAFCVADAEYLPFRTDLFDVVFCESVLTFVEDKAGAIRDFARVTKPGGYVGLNEETWIKTPPPDPIKRFARMTWNITGEIPVTEGWQDLLEGAGLMDIVSFSHRIQVAREASQVSRYRLGDLIGMITQTISLTISNAAFRKYLKGREKMPRNMFDFLGYGLYAGRKPKGSAPTA